MNGPESFAELFAPRGADTAALGCRWQASLRLRAAGNYSVRVRLIELHGCEQDGSVEGGPSGSAPMGACTFDKRQCGARKGVLWRGKTLRVHNWGFLNGEACCELCARARECIGWNALGVFEDDCNVELGNFTKATGLPEEHIPLNLSNPLGPVLASDGGCQLLRRVDGREPMPVAGTSHGMAQCFFAGKSSQPEPSRSPLHLTCHRQFGFDFVQGEEVGCRCADWSAAVQEGLSASDCLAEDHVAIGLLEVTQRRLGPGKPEGGEAGAGDEIGCGGDLGLLQRGRWRRVAHVGPSGLRWDASHHHCGRLRNLPAPSFAVQGEGVCSLRYEDTHHRGTLLKQSAENGAVEDVYEID